MRHMKPDILKESIETILQLIGLVNDRRTLSKNLSGGMKRRLSIGISLIGDPKVFTHFSLFISLHLLIISRYLFLMNQLVASVTILHSFIISTHSLLFPCRSIQSSIDLDYHSKNERSRQMYYFDNSLS